MWCGKNVSSSPAGDATTPEERVWITFTPADIALGNRFYK